jgi:hypothetical protein
MKARVVMGLFAVGIAAGLIGWAVAPRATTLMAGAGNADSLAVRTVRLRVNNCTTTGIKVVPEELHITRNQQVAWIVPDLTSENYRWQIIPKTSAPEYFYQGKTMTIEGKTNGVVNNAFFTDKPEKLPASCNPACEWEYSLKVEKKNTSGGWDTCADKDPKIKIRD